MLAAKVVRRHRLAERLLVDVIGLRWHKVHLEAGRLGARDLRRRRGAPGHPLGRTRQTCPHGNPIPGLGAPPLGGVQRPLAEIEPGTTVRLERISEDVEIDMRSLVYLDEHGFIPGRDRRRVLAGPRRHARSSRSASVDGGVRIGSLPPPVRRRRLTAPPCRASSTGRSSTRRRATAAPARSRSGGRPTSTGADPTAASGGGGGDVWVVASRQPGLADRLPRPPAPPGRPTAATARPSARPVGGRRPRGAAARSAPSSGTAAARCSATCHEAGDRWLAAEGGRGGRGNATFLSNRRRAPAFGEQGERGEERWLDLELKLVADVAIVGFPNVGKSTLISVGLGRQAQGRRLPVHHPRAPPRAS